MNLARAAHLAAATGALLALGWTARHGLAQPGVALAYGVLIAVGEAVRHRPGAPGDARESAPVGAAGSLAYALLGEVGGHPATHGVPQVVAVVLGATLAGAGGRPPAPDRLVRRVAGTALAALCFQPLHHAGPCPYYVLSLLLLLGLTAVSDAALAAALARSRAGGRYTAALRTELRALPGIGPAVCATGVTAALAPAVAGLWVLPLCCLPLLVVQLSAGRRGSARSTCGRTVASLARATELAGCTPAGHAGRVAGLSRAVGRELGMTESGLSVVEYAALMHDVGQLSLVDPVPAGATEPLPPEERRRLARLGGAVARLAPLEGADAAEVAAAVERQADPYREQPLAARVVRTVNAYEDLACGAGHGPAAALELLRRAVAAGSHDHEPRVVEALARVLARDAPERAEA
ncbi:metal-dependent phosphohydrolase [Streptomyces luteireticuli]|uniref:metal-dependent phosphohydrolase n=1 Tax=Streptomyces luteireticuli TaxID=173858 RepID=UPI003557D538